MIKITTVLSKEYQELYPRRQSYSVGGIRHYKEPYIHHVTDNILKMIEAKTILDIHVVTVKRVEAPKLKPKAKVKDDGSK